MKQTRLIMGMPITIELVGVADPSIYEHLFSHFITVDQQFSPYKSESELSRVNQGLPSRQWSSGMRRVFELCEQTKQQTNGYFDCMYAGVFDPSGLVKGLAIQQVAALLWQEGINNFSINAGGDIQVSGHNGQGNPWTIGIRNPFDQNTTVKKLQIRNKGVATSGTAARGQHIYNPHTPEQAIEDIVSLTVIGPNVYHADRFATAAFAMGKAGIEFIERLVGYEAYMIDCIGIATMTSNFEGYVYA